MPEPISQAAVDAAVEAMDLMKVDPNASHQDIQNAMQAVADLRSAFIEQEIAAGRQSEGIVAGDATPHNPEGE